jgi:hypothetical protein
VLQAVQERQDDALRHGLGIDALDCVRERRCLHRHEQEVDGPRELLDHLHAGARRPLGRLDDKPCECNEPDGFGVSNAHDAHACVREPNGERAADGARSENCRRGVHVFAGSTTRLTTF